MIASSNDNQPKVFTMSSKNRTYSGPSMFGHDSVKDLDLFFFLAAKNVKILAVLFLFRSRANFFPAKFELEPECNGLSPLSTKPNFRNKSIFEFAKMTPMLI